MAAYGDAEVARLNGAKDKFALHTVQGQAGWGGQDGIGALGSGAAVGPVNGAIGGRNS